jgi:AraC family transcriptional regulator, regulatory protein of adaptative response / methylated-DNA-[protein]-cysteine methyltransferase
MRSDLPNDKRLYEALVARDPAFEGRAYVGVATTGVFCRLTCPARNPKPENCIFFESVAACMEAGFRPCLRCNPMDARLDADPIVSKLVGALQADPGRRWTECDLVEMGHDPSTVRRTFKRHFGITFLGMARLSRIRNGAETIAHGGRVINAQIDAGFESGSGFRSAFARVLGQSPATFTGEEGLKADWIDTPVGVMIAVADRDTLHLLEFFDRKALRTELNSLQKSAGCAIGIGTLPPAKQIGQELAAFFAGSVADFRTPLALRGSAFTKSVWAALRQIPVGQTRSYSEIAAAIGRPSAVRAVARANGANPIAIVVPCHRVIGADGSLTGYGGGIWRKRWLIAHERKLEVQRATGSS